MTKESSTLDRWGSAAGPPTPTLALCPTVRPRGGLRPASLTHAWVCVEHPGVQHASS